MNIRLEVLGLNTTGDGVKVTAQGKPKGAAVWRTWDRWEFTVPEYIARHYAIGKRIRVKVSP